MAAYRILASLWHIPLIWEEILEYLDLESIKNLRLTDKALNEACLRRRFKLCLEHQTTDLTQESLESLASIATHSLGGNVKHLTILAAVYETSKVERILETKTEIETEQRGA